MPSWTPEGDRALPTDSALRSLAKKCSLLVTAVGNKASKFPEGCVPLPGDNEQRLEEKINTLLLP